MPSWLRFCCLLLAGTCWLSPVFFYHSEEQLIRNRLVDWWYSVTEAGERITKKHVLATRSSAEQILKFIDWLYGPVTVSLRTAWTVAMLCSSSVIAWWVVAVIQGTTGIEGSNPHICSTQGTNQSHWLGLVVVLDRPSWVVFGCPALALLPATVREPYWNRRNLPALALALAGLPYLVLVSHYVLGNSACLVGLKRLPPAMSFLSYSIVYGIALIAITRSILRRATREQGLGPLLLLSVAVIPALFIAIAAAFRVGIVRASVEGTNRIYANLFFLTGAALGNVVYSVMSLGLLVLALLLALNIMFWPLLSRLINAVYSRPPTRMHIFALGTFFFALAFAPSAW